MKKSALRERLRVAEGTIMDLTRAHREASEAFTHEVKLGAEFAAERDHARAERDAALDALREAVRQRRELLEAIRWSAEGLHERVLHAMGTEAT